MVGETREEDMKSPRCHSYRIPQTETDKNEQTQVRHTESPAWRLAADAMEAPAGTNDHVRGGRRGGGISHPYGKAADHSAPCCLPASCNADGVKAVLQGYEATAVATFFF